MRRFLLFACVWLALADVGAQTTLRPRIGSVAGGSGAPVNQPPSIVVVTYTAGVATTSTTASGIASDDILVSSVTCSVNTGASCTVAGTTEWTATIGATVGLSVGDNVVTFTATDGSGLTDQQQVTITYTVPPDGGLPTLTISTAPYSTASATASLSGTATDNVAVTSTRCRNGTSGTNVTGSGSMGSPSVNWTNNTVSLSVGVNTLYCESLDAAGNVSTAQTVDVTRIADTGAPSVTITAISSNGVSLMDGGTTTANDLDLSFTVTDDAGIREIRLADSTTNTEALARKGPRPYSDNASAQTTVNDVSNNNALKAGSNQYCVWAWDAAYAHSGSACITITYAPTTVEIITFGMPNARSGTAYSFHIRGDGGDGSYTWDNQDGGSSLGGSACTGLSITTSADDLGINDGLVSGTPTTTGTCTVNVRLQDGSGHSVNGSLSLVVQAGALTDPYAQWTLLNALTEKVYAAKLTVDSELNTLLPGGVSSSYWTATSDGAQASWGAIADDVSLPDQARVKTTHITGAPFSTGTIHVTWQFKFHRTARSYSCRGGKLDAFYATGFTQKTFQLAHEPTGSADVNGDIFFEQQTQFARGGYACNRIGILNYRLYGNQQNPLPTGVTNGAPPEPCGITTDSLGHPCIGALTYTVRPEVWYQVLVEIRLNQDASAFTDWNTYCSCTLSAGTYHMATIVLWSELDTYPSYLVYRMPIDRYKNDGVNIWSQFHAFWLEFNTSSATTGVFIDDIKAKVRNIGILRNYTPSPDLLTDTTLIARPAR